MQIIFDFLIIPILFQQCITFRVVFLFCNVFFLLHLSSLSIVFVDIFIRSKLNSVLNRSLTSHFFTMAFRLIPYFSFFISFIFSTNCLIIAVGDLFALFLSDSASDFDIPLLWLHNFCSVANAFPDFDVGSEHYVVFLS